MKSHMSDRATSYLRTLCVDIHSRRVGSEGNRAATTFFESVVKCFGFQTERPEFDCIDWTQDGVDLAAGEASFQALASPYSLGCRVRAPLAVVSSVDELEVASVHGEVLLLRGELTKGQLMPKNFPFYNPDEHKHIIGLLESIGPAAIIAATGRDPQMVGSQYPFPLIEDGDFEIPSVYMTDVAGERLARHAGEVVLLESRARRVPAKGCNVIARKGARTDRRVVLFAHVDARLGSPGALDNASGTIVLLLLAELLGGYTGNLSIELVAMNGEDYYCNPGEQQWLRHNDGRFSEILLGINIDDVGYIHGQVAYSLYDCPDALARAIRTVFSAHMSLVEGPPWYQGDHGLFLLNQRPALAMTAERLEEVMSRITHTPQDTPDKVDVSRLAETALALYDLLLELDRVAM